MHGVTRYPLQGTLERLAAAKSIKLRRMTPEQLADSGIVLDKFFQNHIEMVGSGTIGEPLIFVGSKKGLSLSYLGEMLGTWAMTEKMVYCPRGILVAENPDRTLFLQVDRDTKETGYDSRGGIFVQLEDRKLLGILPKSMRGEHKKESIGLYHTDFDYTEANLRHVRRLARELF